MARKGKIINWFERIVAILLFLGVGFKLMHWPGASALILVSGLIFTCISIFRIVKTFFKSTWDYKYKVGNITTILCGLSLGLGIIFKQQHYPGSQVFLIVGLLLLIVSIVMTNWKLPMSKKQMVISSIFCLWVLINFIYYTNRSTHQDEVAYHLVEMEELNNNLLSQLPSAEAEICNAHFEEQFQLIVDLAIRLNPEIDADRNWSEPGLVWMHDISRLVREDGLTSSTLATNAEQFISNVQIDPNFIINDKSFSAVNLDYWKDQLKIEYHYYYPWLLVEYKYQVLAALVNPSYLEDQSFTSNIRKADKRLREKISAFGISQSQFQDSLIWATLFLFFTLYANLIKVPIHIQKPLIFVGVFVFLEFLLLTVDPFLQQQFENGYAVALIEVALAAMVIPFHSMVEHNLYSKEE